MQHKVVLIYLHRLMLLLIYHLMMMMMMLLLMYQMQYMDYYCLMFALVPLFAV